jgi:hypothetical protein
MRCDRSSAQPLHASFRSHPADIILDTGQGIAVVGMQSILYWGRIPGYTSLFKLGIVHRLRLFSRGEPPAPLFSESLLRPANRSIASLHCHSRMPANHQLARTILAIDSSPSYYSATRISSRTSSSRSRMESRTVNP